VVHAGIGVVTHEYAEIEACSRKKNEEKRRNE
jgi:hypothetical protein